MSTKEKTTKRAVSLESRQSMTVKNDETLQSALQLSSKMYEVGDETPETSLISQATRLNNVAHSLVEEREKAYLEDNLDTMTRTVDGMTIDAVCKLSEQARLNIKLAMDIKKDKSKVMVDLVKALKEK